MQIDNAVIYTANTQMCHLNTGIKMYIKVTAFWTVSQVQEAVITKHSVIFASKALFPIV
jgi:AICAR transformylase/IMP cyclohydrolase PurH